MKTRIEKGIKYFRSIKPSEFNMAHYAHFKTFLNLVEEYVTGKKIETRVVEEDVEDIFK